MTPAEFELRSFTELILPLVAPSEARFVTEAYQLAEQAHGAQVRHEVDAQGNRKRFFSHPLMVARYLIERLGCRDAELIAEALLHDVLEDTTLTGEDLETHVGSRITRDVILLSQQPGESKAAYARRLVLFGDGDVLLVKACDIRHNAETIRFCPPDLQAKFAAGMQDYDPVLDRAIELAHPRFRSRLSVMVGEIHDLVLRKPSAAHAAA